MVNLKGVLAIFVVSASVTALARPDLNAFLNERATSITQIVAQVKRDPEVMDRFRRHFAMSDSEVVTYLSTLRPARLEKEGVYQVFSVPPGGAIKRHARTMRAGSAVYVDAEGVPVLVALCANPLTRGPKQPEDLETTVDVNEPVTAMRDVEFAEVDLLFAEDLAHPSVPVEVEQPVTPPVTTGESPIPVISAGPGLGNIFGLLGLGGGLIIGLGQTGGGDDIDVIPEPATLLVLGAGSAWLLRRRRSR